MIDLFIISSLLSFIQASVDYRFLHFLFVLNTCQEMVKIAQTWMETQRTQILSQHHAQSFLAVILLFNPFVYTNLLSLNLSAQIGHADTSRLSTKASDTACNIIFLQAGLDTPHLCPQNSMHTSVITVLPRGCIYNFTSQPPLLNCSFLSFF